MRARRLTLGLVLAALASFGALFALGQAMGDEPSGAPAGVDPTAAAAAELRAASAELGGFDRAAPLPALRRVRKRKPAPRPVVRPAPAAPRRAPRPAPRSTPPPEPVSSEPPPQPRPQPQPQPPPRPQPTPIPDPVGDLFDDSG
jgi:outer membrane biosynthesis protein TonB